MSTPLFRPHGAAQVELSDAILTVHMRGDWNAEMRNQTAQQMRQYAPGLNAAGPWAIINHLHDTLVFSETLLRPVPAKTMPLAPLNHACGLWHL